MLQLYGQYDNGVMVMPGSWDQQPNVYIELMTVVSSAVAELEQDAIAKSRSQSSKGGGKTK